MTKGSNQKSAWAAPKLQRLSAKLAMGGPGALTEGRNTNRS